MALEKAVIINTDTSERISVLFNPEEYSLNHANNFASVTIPGMRAPIIQFTHGNMRTINMELLFDTVEKHQEGDKVINEAGDDVRSLTNKVTGLLDINAQTHAPPILLFTWGDFSFTCVLASANQRFVLFRPDGIPVRARVTITLNEYVDADDLALDARETADFTKLHIVKQGETLSIIAQQHYESAQLWRPIALKNELDDPRSISVGQSLEIPALPYINPETGEAIG